MSSRFERWIDELRDDVIKGTYGHKESEYTVCPDAWRWLYEKGLTPAEAFRCALDRQSRDTRLDLAQQLTHGERMDLLEVRSGQTLH